jgi:hypothetical protein
VEAQEEVATTQAAAELEDFYIMLHSQSQPVIQPLQSVLVELPLQVTTEIPAIIHSLDH